jgi:hypothetical protein
MGRTDMLGFSLEESREYPGKEWCLKVRNHHPDGLVLGIDDYYMSDDERQYLHNELSQNCPGNDECSCVDYYRTDNP